MWSECLNFVGYRASGFNFTIHIVLRSVFHTATSTCDKCKQRGMEKYSEFETCSTMISHLIIIMFFENCLWNGTPYTGSHLYALLTHVTWFLRFSQDKKLEQGHCCLNFIQTNQSEQKMKTLLTFKRHFHIPQTCFLLLWLTVSAVRLDIDSLPINIKIPFFDLLGETEGTELFYFSSCISFPQASPDWGICSL